MKKATSDYILLVASLFLFGYTALRASLLSFTYDESWTYVCYVQHGFTTFKGYVAGDTNNHLLNTWLMQLSVKIFGKSEFVLRLPNVLAHLLFLVYSAKLVRNFKTPLFIISAFLLLNTNPFLLDFFSLARGYGISMGLVMVSIYCAYCYIVGSTKIHSFLSVLFASFAVLAYFSLINYLLILATLLLLIGLYRTFKDEAIAPQFKGLVMLWNSAIVASPLSSLFFIIPVMINLKMVGSMNFGGTNGFWNDTVVYLINHTLYDITRSDLGVALQVFVIVSLAVSLLLIGYGIIKREAINQHLFLMFLFVILLLSFVANYIQFHLMHIPYPVGRYGLIYFVLFTFLVLFLINYLHDKSPKVVRYVFSALTFLSIVNFSCNANLSHVHDWHTETDTREVMKFIAENKKELIPGKSRISIGVSFQWHSDAVFYKAFNNYDHLNVEKEYYTWHQLNDYYYIDKNELSKLPDISYEIIKEYPLSNTLLILNTQKWKTKVIYNQALSFEEPNNTGNSTELAHSGNNSSKTNVENPYSIGFSYIINDSITNRIAIAQFDCMLFVNTLEHPGFTVIEFGNQNSNHYNNIDLKNYLKKVSEWTPVSMSVYLPLDITIDNTIKAYYWNPGGSDAFTDDISFKITIYEKSI